MIWQSLAFIIDVLFYFKILIFLTNTTLSFSLGKKIVPKSKQTITFKGIKDSFLSSQYAMSNAIHALKIQKYQHPIITFCSHYYNYDNSNYSKNFKRRVPIFKSKCNMHGTVRK